MCGRFTLRTPADELAKFFQYLRELPYAPRYNIAPTQSVLAVRAGDGGRDASFLKWGLIPSWAKDPSIGSRMINARAETVAEKPSFRAAFKRRRCLIPADGFYEWKREGKAKQPYFITLRDERPFAFAGLWERREGKDGATVESCTIITTEANRRIRELHDRMPVILPENVYDVWLDKELQEPDALKPLMAPYPDDEITLRPVSTFVNNARNESPQCIEPMHPPV